MGFVCIWGFGAEVKCSSHYKMCAKETQNSRCGVASSGTGCLVIVASIWPSGAGQEWLQGLFAQHDRAGHTERQALLEAPRASGCTAADVSSE